MNKDNLVYIKHIRDAIAAIAEYTADMDRESFAGDNKTRDATVRQLEIIGEAVSNISENFKENHGDIPWRDISDMRNKLIHEYFGVDADTVWRVVRDDLPELKAYMETILDEDK